MLLLLISNAATAQGNKACFFAEKTRGCAPFTVKMHDCSGVTSSNPVYGYYTGGTLDTVTTHTYTNPGKYTITQYVDNGLGTGTDDSTIVDYIEVLPSPVPDFSVLICEAGKVTVKIKQADYEKYIIDFGDGTLPDTITSSLTTHTYSSLSPAKITVTGNYSPGDCGASASEIITPYTALSPASISSLQINTSDPSLSTVSLQFSGEAYYKYHIFQKAGTAAYFLADSAIYQSGSIVKNFSNLNTTQSISYQVITFDDCGNEVSSAEIASIALTVTNGDKTVALDWTSNGLFDQFIIFRNNSPIMTLPASDFSYIDTDILCGKKYCYKIQGKNTTQGFTSTSSEECITGMSSIIPPAVSAINATIVDKHIDVTWTDPVSAPGKTYTVSRSGNGTNTFITSTTSYTDNFQSTPEAYCYSVVVTDACSSSSPMSKQTCPTILQMGRSDKNITLTWTNYTGDATGITYLLEKLDKNFHIISSTPITGTSVSEAISEENALLYYRIKIVGDNGFVAYSNVVEERNEMLIKVPTAFSPNNDGINDVFKAEGRFIETFKMTIFNNWGEVLFSSTDITKGWNGSILGAPVVTGSYAFIIEASDRKGTQKVLSGTVTLLK